MIQANVLQKRSQDTIICNKVIRYMCYVFEYSSDLYKPTFLRLSLSLSLSKYAMVFQLVEWH